MAGIGLWELDDTSVVVSPALMADPGEYRRRLARVVLALL